MDGITGEEDQERGEKEPICCDMHGRNCEPPSELCCRDCSEAAHDTFPIRHADGSVCSAPGTAQGGFERMLADPYEQFDQRGELLKSVIEYANAEPATASGQASSRDHLTAVVLSVADIEQVREVAYRAGREDALRWAADQIDPGSREVSVARRVDRGMVFVVDADRGTATKLRLWADQQARGVGVQPTEEQRAREEDQKRDEED